MSIQIPDSEMCHHTGFLVNELLRSWFFWPLSQARHGTRSPTTKRIKELDRLAVRLNILLNDAKVEAGQNNSSLVNIPAWLWGWKSPWEGKQKGGELITKGENELYLLGKRVREKFPELFDEEYHPDVFSIRATQVEYFNLFLPLLFWQALDQKISIIML